jgi:transcriptional regulator with XRE-family HTH domain
MSEKAIFSKDYQRIVSRLKKARKEKGWSQKELAVKVERTQSHISKIESAQIRIEILQLQELAKALGKKVDYFLDIK